MQAIDLQADIVGARDSRMGIVYSHIAVRVNHCTQHNAAGRVDVVVHRASMPGVIGFNQKSSRLVGTRHLHTTLRAMPWISIVLPHVRLRRAFTESQRRITAASAELVADECSERTSDVVAFWRLPTMTPFRFATLRLPKAAYAARSRVT